ncbi:hypothetical protein I2484_02140 [Sporosarcina sp. E16_8]|nr:hypothetical protein [Sporosarcina sp. E16_8]
MRNKTCGGNHLSNLILGIDAGNHRGKVVGPFGIDSYRTAICDWFERDIVESFADDDMEFCIGGRKGFAGTIAVYEDIYGGASMYGDSKAHDDTLIRVLLAVYRYINKYCPGTENVRLVTGQPIVSHKDSEKKKIQEMLIGHHVFTVNGKQQSIHIQDVRVAAEGSGAFWSSPQMGTVRIIDIGSGTVNVATIIDKRHINNASDTFNFGMETVTNKDDLASVAMGIVRSTTKFKWSKNDAVYLCGGIAVEMLPHIITHYPNARLMQPMLNDDGRVTIADPVFANAIGFYKLARGAFK